MKSSTGFPQIPLLVFVGILINSALLSGVSQKWWDVKPCTEWSIEEVDKMINDSPWVKYSSASSVFADNKQVINPATGRSLGGGHRDLAMYAIRMITAQPMREAYLRRLSFSELGIAVDSKRLQDEKSGKSQLDRLQYLIQSHPDDVLVKGDREHIILDISWSIRTQDHPGQFARGVEVPLPENLRELRLSEFGPVTSLSTDAKRRVLPIRCEYVNYMSVRLYFPRVLANGQPLIDKADKKLWFETRLGTAKIAVKFDLPKMVRQGRIET